MPSAAGAMRFHLVSVPHSKHGPATRTDNFLQFNDDLHLVHTLAGSAVLRVGDQRFETSPRCVIAVPIGVRCLWNQTLRRPWEMINLHYRITLPDGSPIDEQFNLPISFRPAGLPAIHARLRRLHHAWSADDPLTRLTVASEMHTLAARYWRRFAAPVDAPKCQDPLVMQLCRAIRQTGTHSFDAAALATSVNLSPSQMNRRFRAAMHLSPKEYWQQQRIAAVRTALHQSDESLESLAPRLGFNDVYYFCRWFRLQSGMTPGAYRRQSRLLAF